MPNSLSLFLLTLPTFFINEISESRDKLVSVLFKINVLEILLEFPSSKVFPSL